VQTSDQIVNTLLEADEFDPKNIAMQTEFGSDGFEEVMRNFDKHMRDLVQKAKTSGALSGDEPEMMVLKSLLVIAANDFFPGHVPGFKKTLRNLQKFL
jgi:hypothetical protein